MNPDQCRDARSALGWTQGELANAAGVPLWFVVAFERHDNSLAFLAHWEIAMQEAMCKAGAAFPTPPRATGQSDRKSYPVRLETQKQRDAYVIARLKDR